MEAVGVVGKLVHEGGTDDVVWDLRIPEQVVDGDVGYQLSCSVVCFSDNTAKPTPALSPKLYHQLVGNGHVGVVGKVELLQVVCKPLVCPESIGVSFGCHSEITIPCKPENTLMDYR